MSKKRKTDIRTLRKRRNARYKAWREAERDKKRAEGQKEVRLWVHWQHAHILKRVAECLNDGVLEFEIKAPEIDS